MPLPHDDRLRVGIQTIHRRIEPATGPWLPHIDALFEIERSIKGLPVEQRLAVRQMQSASLVATLEAWMRGELFPHADVAGATDYMLKRWLAFTGSSRTEGSVSATTPPSGHCAAWHLAARPGSSPAPIAMDSMLRCSTA